MSNCNEEVTTEEYAAHFDAVLYPGYPHIVRYGGKDYVVKVKEFKYMAKGRTEERHFLRVEIWDAPQEKIQMMVLLTKSMDCRFHSPINPNFDIRPELMGSEVGAYLLRVMLDIIAKFGFSFLVEEIYGEDVGYDPLKKRYNAKRYALVKKFYANLGFEFMFDNELGRGYVMLLNGMLAPSEESCLNNTVAHVLAGK